VSSASRDSGRIDGDLNILFDAFLPDVFVEPLWPHAHFDAARLPQTPARTQSALAVSVASSALRFHPPLCSAVEFRNSQSALNGRSMLRPTNSVSASYARGRHALFGALKDCMRRATTSQNSRAPLALRSATAVSAARPSYQVHQRGHHVRLDSRRRRRRRLLRLHRHGFQFVLQLDHHSAPPSCAHAGNSRQPRQVAPRIADEFFDVHPLKIFSAQSRPHAGCRKQHLKKMFFPRGDKPVERSASSRTMGVDEEGHFVCSSPSAAYVRERHLQRHNHAAHVHEHLIPVFYGEASRSWPIIVRQYCRFSSPVNAHSSRLGFIRKCSTAESPFAYGGGDELLQRNRKSLFGSREQERLWRIKASLRAATEAILGAHLPPAPPWSLTWGARGSLPFPLAKQGYEVHLIDPVELHLEQHDAAATSASLLAAIALGDACKLEFPTGGAMRWLFAGPLYHLIEHEDRVQALGKHAASLKPGGTCCLPP